MRQQPGYQQSLAARSGVTHPANSNCIVGLPTFCSTLGAVVADPVFRASEMSAGRTSVGRQL